MLATEPRANGTNAPRDATIQVTFTEPVDVFDPWVSIAAAVGRTRDGRAPWHPEQAITVSEAVAASSRTRIAVGERADLAILDADPLQATTDELRTLPVAATLLDGRFTHRAL